MTDRKFWEGKYHNSETGWDRNGTSPALTSWLHTLAPCRILIPGCGYGHEVIELARHGFEVTAIDIAEPAIKHMQKQLKVEGLNATLIQGDLFDLKLEPFDAIYEQTCLCALQPTQWAKYARWLHSHLKQHGKLLAMFMQTGAGGGPPFHCDIEEMKLLFSSDLWQWPESGGGIIAHPSGRHEISLVLERL